MRKIKVIAVIVSLILVIGMLAGCGAAVIEKPTVSEGVSTVEITGYCEMKVEGTKITVTGETNFIPGTLIDVSIVAQSGRVIDSIKISKSDDKISQVFLINDDKYDKDVKTITAYISCAPSLFGKQTEGVYMEYGEKFERIESDYLWNKDGIVVMFASDSYDM